MPAKYRDYALTIVLVILAALSAYYTTIESLKVELSGKAEENLVANLDKRLSNLETRLAENFATKRDFYQLKEDLLLRLTRIETRLDNRSGYRQSSVYSEPLAVSNQTKHAKPNAARFNGQGVNH
jgi:predicted Holliday junction resolvase-like endonuclease